MKVLTVCFLLFLFSLGFNGVVSADEQEPGKVEKFEKELQDTTGRSAPRKERDDRYLDQDAFFDDSTSCNCCLITCYGLWMTFGVVPDEADEFYLGSQPQFPAYPYAVAGAGRYCYREKVTETKPFSVSSFGEYYFGGGFRGDGWNLRMFPAPFIELVVETSVLREDTLNGEDKIRLTNYAVNYCRFRWPVYNFYWGMGAMEINRSRFYRAFSLNIGMEAFPVKPLSLSYDYSGGFFENVSVSEHTLAARWHLHRLAVRLGYRNWQAEEARLETALVGLEIFY